MQRPGNLAGQVDDMRGGDDLKDGKDDGDPEQEAAGRILAEEHLVPLEQDPAAWSDWTWR